MNDFNNTASQLLTEVEEVRQSIVSFYESMVLLDFERITELFHEEGRAFGVLGNGTLWVQNRNNWKEKIDRVKERRKKGEKVVWEETWNRFEIKSIDVVGIAAAVKVELTLPNGICTDFYNVVKIENKWVITNKTWHMTLATNSLREC
ncbi:MAG: nuclear transport factor 2 family protein [Candidatus Kariarchaeaceae archaeon]|jgi:hypothetical protein